MNSNLYASSDGSTHMSLSMIAECLRIGWCKSISINLFSHQSIRFTPRNKNIYFGSATECAHQLKYLKTLAYFGMAYVLSLLCYRSVITLTHRSWYQKICASCNSRQPNFLAQNNWHGDFIIAGARANFLLFWTMCTE